jgi:serine protease Do
VTVRDGVSEDLLEHLGIDGALGVQDVQPGTLAESLGIQSGDLVARIAGKSIGSTQDVQDALAPIEAGQDVEVIVYRKGNALTLRAKKPDVKPAEGAAPLQKRDAGERPAPSGDGKR